MSTPYGAPPPHRPNPGAARAEPPQAGGNNDLTSGLPLVAAVAGLVAYLLGFFDQATATLIAGPAGLAIVVAGALAALRRWPSLPNSPAGAAALAVYGTLAVLQSIVTGAAGGVAIVLLVMALVQVAALVGLALVEAGAVRRGPRRARAPKPGKGTGSGPFPPLGGPQFGQAGPPQFGQPVQQQPGNSGAVHVGPGSAGPGSAGPGSAGPGNAAPGQPGQPWGPPPGGYAGPPPGFAAPPNQAPNSGQPNQPEPQSGGHPAQGEPQSGGQPAAPDGPAGTRQMPHPNRES